MIVGLYSTISFKYLKAISDTDFFSCEQIPQTAEDTLPKSIFSTSSFGCFLPNPFMLMGYVGEKGMLRLEWVKVPSEYLVQTDYSFH